MCTLCSQDEKEQKAAREHHKRMSDRFKKAARYYDDLAYGLAKPHDDLAKQFGHTARVLIQELVNEWM